MLSFSLSPNERMNGKRDSFSNLKPNQTVQVNGVLRNHKHYKGV